MRNLFSRHWPELAVFAIGVAAMLIVCNHAPAQCQGGQCAASAGVFAQQPVRTILHAAVDGVGHGPVGEAVQHRPHVIQTMIHNRPRILFHGRRGCG